MDGQNRAHCFRSLRSSSSALVCVCASWSSPSLSSSPFPSSRLSSHWHWYGYCSAGTVDGSFYGNAVQLGKQCAGITVTIVYSAIATSIIFGVLWALAKATGTTLVIPIALQDQADKHMHGEEAYASASASTALATPAPSPTDDPRKELGAKAAAKAHPRPHATSASELELEAEGVAVGGDNGVPGGLHPRGAATLDSFGSGGATPPQGSPANPNPPAGRRSSAHGAVPATPERVTVHVEMVPHAQASTVAV